jgi:hypothetical protein
MADIHGVPDESMMVPVQAFQSVPLPDLTAAVDAAGAVAGAGIVYPVSDRQDEAQAILESPQGAGLDGQDVLSGGAAGWPADIEPGDPVNPIQGMGDYPAGM